ncbi:MAG: peptidase M16 [Moraxellaceae bacterium]|nr:MAG: peptidase M16 [Moraxellaceae bacterium]
MTYSSPFKTNEQRQRFNRKTLNIMIIVVSIMIVLFYNIPGGKMPNVSPTNDNSSDISAELAGIDEDFDGTISNPKDNPIDSSIDKAATEKNNDDQSFHPEKILSSLALIAEATPKSHEIDIQSWNTKKGAQVLFVAAPEVPMLDVRLVFNAGGARDPQTLPGLALLTNGMITEGSENHNVDEIAAHFESLGAALSNASYRDMATISLRTLSEANLQKQALDVFYEIVATPTFPDDSFQRLLKQLTLGLKHEKQNPKRLISKKFYQSLYQTHPYGHRIQGTAESLGKITLKDLKDFYANYYVSSNVVIAITGDIQRADAESIANAIDARLAQGNPAPRLPTPAPITEKQDHFIEFPSSQSHVLIGSLGIKRGDERWHALVLGNEILGGGGFSSRLNQTIRQEKGLVYSVYSYFSPMAVNGPFMMGLQTKNEQRQQASKLMLDILQTFAQQGPTLDELNDAKKHLLGNFPLNIASNSRIVDYLGLIGFYNLPLSYLETYPKNIERVTIDDIKQAFATTLDTDKLITIALGKENVAPETAH